MRTFLVKCRLMSSFITIRLIAALTGQQPISTAHGGQKNRPCRERLPVPEDSLPKKAASDKGGAGRVRRPNRPESARFATPSLMTAGLAPIGARRPGHMAKCQSVKSVSFISKLSHNASAPDICVFRGQDQRRGRHGLPRHLCNISAQNLLAGGFGHFQTQNIGAGRDAGRPLSRWGKSKGEGRRRRTRHCERSNVFASVAKESRPGNQTAGWLRRWRAQ